MKKIIDYWSSSSSDVAAPPAVNLPKFIPDVFVQEATSTITHVDPGMLDGWIQTCSEKSRSFLHVLSSMAPSEYPEWWTSASAVPAVSSSWTWPFSSILPSWVYGWTFLLCFFGFVMCFWLVWKRWVVFPYNKKFVIMLDNKSGNVCRVVNNTLIAIRQWNERVYQEGCRYIELNNLPQTIMLENREYTFLFTIHLRITDVLLFFHYGHPPEYSLECYQTHIMTKLSVLFESLTEHDLLLIQLNPERQETFREQYTEHLRYYRSMHETRQGSATEILKLSYTITEHAAKNLNSDAD